MTRPIVRIHDISTDTVVDREMNDAEFAQYEADQASKAERDVAVANRESERQALFTRLGITAEEARLLLGGN